MYADLVFLNGQVITMAPDQPQAEAVAVSGGRIGLIGSTELVRTEVGRATQVIDLAGQTLLPGFNDAHLHMLIYGQTKLLWLNCRPEVVSHLDDILAMVKAETTRREPGQWIRGRGYNDLTLPPNNAITRRDLDRVAPDHPVCLTRLGGHVIVGNSYALNLAGITRDTPDPPGGKIDREPGGEPTGVLRETAQPLLYDIIPPPTPAETKACLLRAAADYLAAGITSVQNAGSVAADLQAFQELALNDELPLRVSLMVKQPVLDSLIEAGLKTGFGNDRLKLGPLKIFLDGGILARTAAQHQPYQNDPDNRGILWMEQEELNQLVERAHRAGFQIATHAIGDRAIESILDAYERALRKWPARNHRHRIEHCELITGCLLDRIVDLDVLPVPQPIFLREGGDGYIKNLGEERAHKLLPLRRMLDAGLPLSGSSDSPVSAYNPLQGIETAVTRRIWDGRKIGPGQEVTVAEALRMYTRGGAYASFEENQKGTIETGKLADFVVLDRNPLTTPPDELASIGVTMTVLGGKIAYQGDAAR